MTKTALARLSLAAWMLVAGCSTTEAVVPEDTGPDAGGDAGDDGGASLPSDEWAKVCWVSSIKSGRATYAAPNPGVVDDVSALVVGRSTQGLMSFGDSPEFAYVSASKNDGFLAAYDEEGEVLDVQVVDWKIKWASYVTDGVLVREDDECTPEDDFGCEDADYLAIHIVKYGFDFIEHWRASAGEDFVWYYDVGDSNTDAPIAVAVLADDGFALAGAFMGQVVLGQGQAGETTLAAAGPDTIGAYVARFDADGILLAAHALAEPLLPVAMVAHDGGETTVVGLTDQLDLPIGLEVLRATDAGETIWHREVAADLVPDGFRFTPDDVTALDVGGGALVIGGGFRGNLVFDDGDGPPIEITSPGYPADGLEADPAPFLAGIDDQGSWGFAYAATADPGTWIWAGGLAIAADGDVRAAGWFSGPGPVILGSGQPNETAIAASPYLAVYDTAGQLELAKSIGPLDGVFYNRSLAALADGSSLVCGEVGEGSHVDITLHDGEPASFECLEDKSLSLVLGLCPL